MSSSFRWFEFFGIGFGEEIGLGRSRFFKFRVGRGDGAFGVNTYRLVRVSFGRRLARGRSLV